jgi:hypothetical protein
MIGPVRPGLPDGCDVTVLPGKQPDFPVVDVASARAWCHFDRADCIDELRKRACATGADVVYSFSESVGQENSFISATLAYRDTSRAQHAPAAARAAAPGDCTPICSPGFACRAGACIPQCNPPCEAGEVCNRHRTCEPATAAAGPPPPAAGPPPPAAGPSPPAAGPPPPPAPSPHP